MFGNKAPICELKDNLDMAIAKFVKDSKLQELLPEELRCFLPKNFEAEGESTVSKIIKFRTKPSQLLTIKKTAKAVSTISQEDALIKAKKYAQLTANAALDQESVALQRSVDLASINDTECGLDSTTLDEYIEKSDEKIYMLKKDLILVDLDLIIKKDETLTIPKGINLTNKKFIQNLGKMINYGNIKNENEILHNVDGKEGGQFTSYMGSSYTGKIPSLTDSSITWPSGTDLFNVDVTAESSPNITFTNNSNTYCITQTQNTSTSTTITLNTSQVPAGITGFYVSNLQSIGGGGGGGGAKNVVGSTKDSNPSVSVIGNGGAGGANIVTPTLNYYDATNPIPIISDIEISFTTGSGGTGGTCSFTGNPNWSNWVSSITSNGAGSPGGESSITITNTSTNPATNYFSQQAGGGLGGTVLDIFYQVNTENFDSNCQYSPLAVSTSSSSQYYNIDSSGNPTPITTPIVVNGFSSGYGGMSYNANSNYNSIPDSTNGQPPSGGSYGAGGGSGVAQGPYSNSGTNATNPYSGAQAGGGGGSVTSNVGGLGYTYYTPPTSSTPVQPSPSTGGGGGGAGILWNNGGSNSGQDGGTGYNSITITFV
jgi:hypothetical protein